MAEQKRLEKIAIELRHNTPYINNDYSKEDGKVYSDQHPDAKSNGTPLGKGTGVEMDFSVPGSTESRAISTKNLITTESPNQTVGGYYDIYGTEGVTGAFQGKSGRKWANTLNLYSVENEYSADSVDTSANLMEGQYRVD